MGYFCSRTLNNLLYCGVAIDEELDVAFPRVLELDCETEEDGTGLDWLASGPK